MIGSSNNAIFDVMFILVCLSIMSQSHFLICRFKHIIYIISETVKPIQGFITWYPPISFRR